MSIIKRHIFPVILKRLHHPRCFIQGLTGPRQVGKTTLARQVAQELKLPSHYASADEPTLKDSLWLEQQWEIGRITAQQSSEGALLILDEIQKIPQWSEKIKKLWDEDTHHQTPLKVIILGSSTLLIQKGLTESLAGRFEILPITHWSYGECQEAFGWSLEQYIYFGGYPGAALLIEEEERWRRYILDSLIETTISRDIMLMARIHKPALLRRVFELGCLYSGQILSYQKMLGQLQDAGNTVTVAHYLDLLAQAGMVAGLTKFSLKESLPQKTSSPKLQVLNTAFLSALKYSSFQNTLQDREEWGRLVESAIGAHLLNARQSQDLSIHYWREGVKEVDFVLKQRGDVIALEVKSGARKTSLNGMISFIKKFNPKRILLVGGQGIPLEQFFLTSPQQWL